MRKIILIFSILLVLNACAVDNSKESIVPEEREREYYLKETMPYLSEIISEFELIYSENYMYTMEMALNDEYPDFSEFTPNMEASSRRHLDLKMKLVTEQIPTEGLRESHREKIDAFKKTMILVCGKREKASDIPLVELEALGDDYYYEDIRPYLVESLNMVSDSKEDVSIAFSDLYSIEHDLDIKAEESILPRN